MSKTDVTEAVSSLEVIHGGAKFIDANHNPLWHNPIASTSGTSCLLQHVPPDVGGDYREGWD